MDKSIFDKAKSADASKPSLFARELEGKDFNTGDITHGGADAYSKSDVHSAQQKALQELYSYLDDAINNKELNHQYRAGVSMAKTKIRECCGEVERK